MTYSLVASIGPVKAELGIILLWTFFNCIYTTANAKNSAI